MNTPQPVTTIRECLASLRPQVLAVVQRHGASNLRLFGSVATGREHASSDIDLLVDLSADQSLLGLFSLRQELEDLLGCPVDVTETASLDPLIRSEVLSRAIAL
jgi:predicted nucleotidyltransferase